MTVEFLANELQKVDPFTQSSKSAFSYPKCMNEVVRIGKI